MKPVRIGTSLEGGTFHSQGVALAALLAGRGIPAEALVTPRSGAANAMRLEADEIDFGFIAANWVGRARRGERPFVEPLAIRMVAPMNIGPLYFIARADSGLASVRDLRGKRVVVGPRNGGMASHAQVILGALGMGFSDITPVYLEFAEGGEAVASGAADAQLQCPIPNDLIDDLDSRVDLRVLDFTPEDIARVLAASPVHRGTIMKAGALRALDEDSRQPAVLNVLITHERVSRQMVRDIVGSLFFGARDLGKANPLFEGLAELFLPLRTHGAAAFTVDGVPLHDGAVDACRAARFIR